MANRKWGAITSGATFESLVKTIVCFEDPEAVLFGRRGPDGGQDARSGDGTRVFQAKHHVSGSAAVALRDAKGEADVIARYRDPSHARHDQWAGVTHWRLVTNSTFNPSDKLKWDTEIVPLFAGLGLVADYWEQANLDALLDKHPEISRSYFENETRVFLSIPEIWERLPREEPFLRRAALGPFCGRAAEKETIAGFLASDKKFLVIHGSGGTGKTRLMVDAGDEIAGAGEWQVLWANIESMKASGRWFDAIAPERPTLILIDEPPDQGLLPQLAEQVGSGRTKTWKIIISVRSPKDPVLGFLRGARMKQRVEELALLPLPVQDAEEMCYQLLQTGKRSRLRDDVKREMARKLCLRFTCYPVWLTLAVQHIEDHGTLERVPMDAETLADQYLEEIEVSQSQDSQGTVRAVLRWVALIGTVNREDDEMMKLIGDRIQISSVVDVRARLRALVRRGALAERGARNRFIELKPDVLRDYVLRRWLTENGGDQEYQVSGDGEELLGRVRQAALKGSLNTSERAILESLARTETILRFAGYDIGLLKRLFVALEDSIPQMPAHCRTQIGGIVENIAHIYPREVTSLVRCLRQGVVADEEIELYPGGKRLVIGQANIIPTLSRPLLASATGAKSTHEKDIVLREMCMLVEAEAALFPIAHRVPSDGRHAASSHLSEMIQGGPRFRGDYDDVAKTACIELLDKVALEEPSCGQSALLQALVASLLEVERMQTWADDRTFTWRKVSIVPGGSAWLAREAVLARLKEVLQADTTPLSSRTQLWRVFPRGGSDILNDLRWAYDVLASRDSEIEELLAARKLWEWHHRHSKDPQCRDIAGKLEIIYANSEYAREFEPLLPGMNNQEIERHVVAKSTILAAGSASEISAFLDRAKSFPRIGADLTKLFGVAVSLGKQADSHQSVRDFILEELKARSIGTNTEFVLRATVWWVASVRISEPGRTRALVDELLSQCGSDEWRGHLLERMYAQVPPPRDAGDFSNDERILVRESKAIFMKCGQDVALIKAVAFSVGDDWPLQKSLLEDTLEQVPEERLSPAIHALIDAVHWSLERFGLPANPLCLSEWLLAQVLRFSDGPEVDDMLNWSLTQILNRLGSPDVQWLSKTLAAQREVASPSRAGRSIPRIGKYVRPIDRTQASDPNIASSFNVLLDLAGIAYALPDFLRDIDPDGVVVPDLFRVRIGSCTQEAIVEFSCYAATYSVNSEPWRLMALSALRAAIPFGEEILHRVYHSLGEYYVSSWICAVGEVPSAFIEAVALARGARDTEVHPELKSYWDWRLSLSEAELRRQEEDAKEERGE